MRKEFILILLFGFVVNTGCERLGNNFKEKINEKAEQKMEESLRKVDSAINQAGSQLDSMKEKTFKSMDSVIYKLDSANKELNDIIEKQKEKLKLNK